MKERPIIFSTEMVRAILEGRKTQTRRVIKPQAHHYVSDLLQPFLFYPCKEGEAFGDIDKQISSPYGYPWKEWKREKENDRLWVRETYCIIDDKIYYKSDKDYSSMMRWKPSIFMPREASRITLEIINIRVEHVQDIPYEDRVKEGITFKPGLSLHEFRKLWNSIHKRENRWEDNPWVWVIEFKRIG